MVLSAQNRDFRELNKQIRNSRNDITLEGCCGQRFIGSGLKAGGNAPERSIIIHGTPGNALGAYLDGASIEVHGNVQDAVGDTMNGGRIVVHGNAGDALGYAMRGGSIFVHGNAGYRTGIHMKQYKPASGPDKRPVIVVGGRAGCFLGEYLAGGLIIVLGIGCAEVPVGSFTGTGMHGGRIFIRTEKELTGLPSQVTAEAATPEDMEEIHPILSQFAALFGLDDCWLAEDRFLVLKPHAQNPYKQLYTAN